LAAGLFAVRAVVAVAVVAEEPLLDLLDDPQPATIRSTAQAIAEARPLFIGVGSFLDLFA
jgi:hypothetical protein